MGIHHVLFGFCCAHSGFRGGSHRTHWARTRGNRGIPNPALLHPPLTSQLYCWIPTVGGIRRACLRTNKKLWGGLTYCAPIGGIALGDGTGYHMGIISGIHGLAVKVPSA